MHALFFFIKENVQFKRLYVLVRPSGTIDNSIRTPLISCWVPVDVFAEVSSTDQWNPAGSTSEEVPRLIVRGHSPAYLEG